MKSANRFNPDDQRFTAYALGELDAGEQAEVERLIASDPQAAIFIDEVRATAGTVEREYAAEIVASSSQTPLSAARPPARKRSRHALLQAAGLTVLIGGVVFLLTKSSFDWAPVGPELSRVAKRTDSIHEPLKAGIPQEVYDNLSPEQKAAVHADYQQLLTERLNSKPEAIDETTRGETVIGVGITAHAGQGAPAAMSARRSESTTPADSLAAFYDRGGSEDLRAKVEELYDGEKGTRSNTEGYNAIVENAFKLASQDPLSTFSIDVDTASYANVRRFLNDGQLPPADAVRIEELINYFRYAYPAPEGNAPFSTTANVASCPWAPTHKLVQVGLRARDIDMSKRLPSNFVFLVDVSGSMNEPDKLPLLKRSLRLLVDQLDGRDRIAIVVYAGASGLVLPSTTCSAKALIEHAIESLQPGGSTNGAAGIELAYDLAAQNRIEEGQNRVILCTDGDFNVGVTDQGSLVRLIEEKRKSNVFLSVLGFGRGNVKDSTMEMLADKGNGNYAYIDSLNEARKVLVSEMGGTLFTVAKDVKIQVEFNPTRVQAWRLIGYENRQLAHQDFNDDKKDAGDIGAGHNVTAFYEVVPVGVQSDVATVDPLKYQHRTTTTEAAYTDELLTLKLRYKAPESDTSQLISTPIADTNRSWTEAPSDFRYAAAVAAFGMVLRKSVNVGTFGLQNVIDLAVPEIGDDGSGYRREFVDIVRKAQSIDDKPKVR
jgi:Ca-activated chloride channel family protein